MIFLNGLNLIRCSENQIQIFRLDESGEETFQNSAQCSNSADLLDNPAEFLWDTFSVACSTDESSSLIKEKQYVVLVNSNNIRRLPDAIVVNGEATGISEVTTDHEQNQGKVVSTVEFSSIFSNPTVSQSIEDSTQLRRIYVLFAAYRVLCRLIYTSTFNDLCRQENPEEISDVDHFCYYTPLTDRNSTISELESEFNQIQSMDVINRLPIGQSLLLNVSNPSAFTSDSDSDETVSTIDGQMIPISTKRKTIPTSSSKPPEKNSRKLLVFSLVAVLLFVIIVILIVILILIYRKNRPPPVDNANQVIAINSIDPSIDRKDHSMKISLHDNIASVGAITKNPGQRKIAGNSMMFNDEN